VPAISPRQHRRCNKEHAVSPADDALVRHGKAWPQQLRHTLELPLVEAGEFSIAEGDVGRIVAPALRIDDAAASEDRLAA
jgi:hypothetical protein